MNLYLILTFLITVIIYAMLHLGKEFFSKNILIVIGASLLMGTIVFKYDVFTWTKYFAAVSCAFVAGVAAFHSNKILPTISEQVVHIIGLIYVYQLLINYNEMNIVLFLLLLIPFVVIMHYCIDLKEITNKEKIFLYSLFVLILTYIEFYNLKMIVLYNFPKNEPKFVDFQLLLSTFFISGILFYIIIYISNLIQVLPIRRENESAKAMRIRLKSDSFLFISKFKDKQAKPVNTIVISIIIVFILILNIKFNIIRNNYITEYLLGFTITSFENKTKLLKITNFIRKKMHHFT